MLCKNTFLESLSKEAVVERCSVKRVLLKFCKIHSKIHSSTGVYCEFSEVSKNTFSYRAPTVAVSVSNTVKCVQAVRLATLLKRDSSIGVSEPAICRSSTKWVFLNQ